MIRIKLNGNEVQLAAEELSPANAEAVQKLIDILIKKGVKLELMDRDPENPDILSVLKFNAEIDGKSYSYSVPSHEMSFNHLTQAKYQSIDVVLAELCNALDIKPDFIIKSAKGKQDKPADAGAMKELFTKLLGFGLLVGAGAASAIKVKDLLNNDQAHNDKSGTGSLLSHNNSDYDFLMQYSQSDLNPNARMLDTELEYENKTSNVTDDEFDGYLMTFKTRDVDKIRINNKGRKLSELGESVTSYMDEDDKNFYETRQISQAEYEALDDTVKKNLRIEKNFIIHSDQGLNMQASSKKNSKRNKNKEKKEKRSKKYEYKQAKIDSDTSNNLFEILPDDLPKDGAVKVKIYLGDSGAQPMSEVFGVRLREGVTVYPSWQSHLPGNRDVYGHGTRVGSIAAGLIGGFAHKAEIVPIKILDDWGDSSPNGVIRGLDKIIELYKSDQKKGIKTLPIINLSLSTKHYSHEIQLAMGRASKAGILIVACAGNYNIDACQVSPAAASRQMEGVITVGSVDDDMKASKFSDKGICVTVWAPGEGVKSPIKQVGELVIENRGRGTSLSAPMVTGILANIWGKEPNLSRAQVIQKFMSYTKEINGLKIAMMPPNPGRN